eukprot:UN09631
MSKFNYFNPNSITLLSLILFTTPLISQQTIPTFPPDTLPTFPPGACCVIPADQGCIDIICFYVDGFCCDVQFDRRCEAIAYDICHPPVQTTFEPSIQTTTTTTQITNIPTPSPIPISEPTNTATTTTTFEPTDIPPTPEPTFSPIFIPTQTGLCCTVDQACQDFVCNNGDPFQAFCCNFGWDGICDAIAQDICQYPPNFNMTAAPSFQIPIPTSTQTKLPT